MAEERLQKILAGAGIASRRKAEELITTGHVSVNGKTVTQLGSKADLEVDEVKVDGQRLKAPNHHVYYAFHKPKNVITTVSDPERRETVMHYFKGVRERIYPVGRLDYASEGLLLLTNDGDFANKISSPATHIAKTYLAKINGVLTSEQEETFRRGVPMHGQRTAPAKLRRIREGENPWYEVTITEGRQNQIRIMFKHFGFLVEKLRRTRIGFLELAGLKPGAYRTLTRHELERFQKMLSSESATNKHDEKRSVPHPTPQRRKADGREQSSRISKKGQERSSRGTFEQPPAVEPRHRALSKKPRV